MVDRTLRRIFILAGIALIIWVLYLLKPVVVPFVGAFFIAYLFSPLVDRLHRIGLPRWLSISIVFIGIGVVLTLAMWYLVPLVWKQLMYARDSIPAGIHWVNYTFLPWLSDTFNLVPMEIDTNQISSVVMDYVQTNYSADSIQAMALKLAQSGISFIQIGGTIVKGQFLVMVLLGVVYAVGLQLIGLEIGLIIGMVAGLCSIIPYLGFAVGIIAAVVATLFQFGIDWWQLVLVGIVFMVGQAVEGYILQPFLLGDKIGLSPVAVVFAVLAGAQLAGFLGMLIALPVAAVIVVLLRHAREFYEKSALYDNRTLIIQKASTGSINIETPNVDVDIDLKSPHEKALQADEKSSKIEKTQLKDG